MRVGREDDDCIAQQEVLFIGGEDPPRADSTRGAAARGRQHPAARVAPPQILMGCSPVVAAAQTLPIQYSNIPESSNFNTLVQNAEDTILYYLRYRNARSNTLPTI
jgi:hypothetical protein